MRLALPAIVVAYGVIAAPAVDAQRCDPGRNPVTEMGARFQLSQQILTATSNNPLPLVHESPTDPVRYLRARLSARSLGAGNWYATVRDMQGHPLQTFSRSDFALSADRWTGRIPGAVATIDVVLVGSATSPELEVTEYVAMPRQARNPYYSVKKPGQEDFHPLYTTHNDIDPKFRPWGDLVGFVMGSWSDRLWGCSGAIVGPNLFLTAWHCGGAGGDRMPDVAYWNSDICRDLLVDLSWDDDGSSRDYGCVRVVDKNKERDFALIEIAPIGTAGNARPGVLSVAAPAKDAPVVLIHHPLYMRKQITMRCAVHDWSVPGWTAATPQIDFSHDCDTEGGSSGAPVFNMLGEIVGLHHHGHAVDPVTCREGSVNKAVRIDQIIGFLEKNRAKNANVVDKLTVVH